MGTVESIRYTCLGSRLSAEMSSIMPLYACEEVLVYMRLGDTVVSPVATDGATIPTPFECISVMSSQNDAEPRQAPCAGFMVSGIRGSRRSTEREKKMWFVRAFRVEVGVHVWSLRRCSRK
jgi:hypothetical protein